MLSAFTARTIIELKPRDKSRIEAILAYGDRVLVGLNTGALRVYRVNELHPAPKTPNGLDEPPKTPVGSPAVDTRPASQSSQKPTDLLREVEKFSTRAIEQLAIIKEANTLVSLSNYCVSLHDLQTYEPIETLGRTRNASCFAVTSNILKDPATGIPEIISRLAVAVKRRLLLWSWHESELDPEPIEVVLTESIRSLTWASATKVVCGMNSGYVLVNVLTKEVDDIVRPENVDSAATGQGRFGAISTASMGYMGLGGYTPKPLSTNLAGGEILLVKDVSTLFVDEEGKPREKKQMPWQTAPEAVGYSYPYILALQSPTKGTLEIRNPDTLTLLQTISLAGAAQLHFPPPNVSLAHAAKGFHISSERCVWKMDATDYDSQVKELVDSFKFDEAISILNMLEDALLKNKTETRRETKMLKAEVLFREKAYQASMDLFNEEDVNAPPERVLRLFPPMISGELSAWAHSGDDESDAGIPDRPNRSRGNDTASIAGASPPRTGGGWGSMFRKTASETASIKSPRKNKDADDDGASIKTKATVLERPLEGKDLTSAAHALATYLAQTRSRLQRVIDPRTGRLKPPSSKNKTAEENFKNFLSAAHSDSDRKLEEELQQTFGLVDTTLFRTYMFVKSPLAGPLFRLPNFCDPDVVNEKLLEQNRYNELVDFFYGKQLHSQALELLKKFGASEQPDEAAPSLHGPQRTIGYLQKLPPQEIDLILKYSEWTLREAPEEAMEVFIADSENAETLPRDRVVKFLDGIDQALEIRYLEHIIAELNDLTPEFHNRLAELMIRHLKEKPRSEEWDNLMDRFVKFLRASRQYSLSRAFGMIPREDPSFHEAQAVILFLMGQHKQALEIYVFKMKDYAKAEEYCNQVHKTQDSAMPSAAQTRRTPVEVEDEAPPSIYHTLLSLYLTPSPPNEPRLEPALDLLSKHGSRLPAESTLSLIPDDLPVSKLEAYFCGRIRSATSIVNGSKIVAGLRASEYVSTQALLLLGDGAAGGQGGRNRRVVVTDERLCGVCHKRLGGSVISVLADNSVVHYGCASKVGHRPETARAPSWGRTSLAP